MVFTSTERPATFRRVFDVLNRASDRGLYVNPQNRYTLSTLATGTAAQTNGQYQHVVVTVTGDRFRFYVNGRLDMNLGTASMNLLTANRIVGDGAGAESCDQGNRRYAATLAADNLAFIAPANLFGVTTISGLGVRPARPG